MGEDALDSQVKTVEDEKQDVVVENTEQAEGSEGGEGSQELQETDSLEIVRRSDEGSQPKTRKPTGRLNKRFKELTSQRDTAKGETAEATNELRIEQEKNKLLSLALEQSKSTKAYELPNPEDFDDGVNDPGYRQALQTHTESLIDSRVSEAVNRSTVIFTATQDKKAQDARLRHGIDKHYERAEALGARDYTETENIAIDILGKSNVSQYIGRSDNSEIVLYYLGKNPDKAEAIAALLDDDAISGTLQLGALGELLENKSQGNLNPAPAPDDELEGGSPSASTSNMTKYDRQLDKLREEGDMSKIMAFKRKAKEDGVIS